MQLPYFATHRASVRTWVTDLRQKRSWCPNWMRWFVKDKQVAISRDQPGYMHLTDKRYEIVVEIDQTSALAQII